MRYSARKTVLTRFYADFDKALPADLVNRLANIDARRQPVTASSHAGTNMEDMQSNGNEMNSDEDDDYIIDDEDGCDDDDDLDDTDEDDSNGNNGGCEEVDDH
ncbi:uncharacterized protein C2845_PM07G06420 [Panicum miliaceum]|uniref:Uncharacterized protein n=1 Tax=Panicum miliaceum TaxID=4540 RepID=A0A3L6SGU6_PANMI|nr:uncharacterized protein C2845_PM07G06420 [Panicum miliaceum]